MTKNGLIKLIEKSKSNNASKDLIVILENALSKWDSTPDYLRWALTHRNHEDWLKEE